MCFATVGPASFFRLSVVCPGVTHFALISALDQRASAWHFCELSPCISCADNAECSYLLRIGRHS